MEAVWSPMASEATFSEGSGLAQRMRLGRTFFPEKCRWRRTPLRPGRGEIFTAEFRETRVETGGGKFGLCQHVALHQQDAEFLAQIDLPCCFQSLEDRLYAIGAKLADDDAQKGGAR